MLRYIIRRVLWAIALLFLVSFITFVIFYAFPSSDPAALRAGRSASPSVIKEIRHNLKLDRPVLVQYGYYMQRLLPLEIHTKHGFGFGWHGPDLGYSYQSNQSVKSEIISRLPATISLSVGAAIIWFISGVF